MQRLKPGGNPDNPQDWQEFDYSLKERGMRSTKTATTEARLHWEAAGGDRMMAEYGDWYFKVYAWQKGSYTAIAKNNRTGALLERGHLAGEIRTQSQGKAWCEGVFEQLHAEDRQQGIERE